MKKLIISGNESQLDIIKRQIRMREQKYNLSVQLIEVDEETPNALTAVESIELIKIAETEEDLKLFENDERTTVNKAWKLRKVELGL